MLGIITAVLVPRELLSVVLLVFLAPFLGSNEFLAHGLAIIAIFTYFYLAFFKERNLELIKVCTLYILASVIVAGLLFIDIRLTLFLLSLVFQYNEVSKGRRVVDLLIGHLHID